MSKKRTVGVAIAIASLTSLEPTKVFGQNPTESTEATQGGSPGAFLGRVVKYESNFRIFPGS